jgi:hypothetical protein
MPKRALSQIQSSVLSGFKNLGFLNIWNFWLQTTLGITPLLGAYFGTRIKYFQLEKILKIQTLV